MLSTAHYLLEESALEIEDMIGPAGKRPVPPNLDQILSTGEIMPRVKLEPLDEYRFHQELSIRVTDLNYGGHLGNDALVSLLHEARANLLYQHDLSEFDLGDGATGNVQSDLVVNYLNEGFAFEQLTIDLDIRELTKKSFRVYYRFRRGEELIALAETGMVAYKLKEQKLSRLPDTFVEAFG